RVQFPGEIDGVAYASVHSLAAGGAMDMRCVAEQEGAPFLEVLRHAVVSGIGREPVHLFDFDPEIIDDPAADILELERVGMLGAFVAYCSDQARASLSGQWKHTEEIGLLEINMEFAVKSGA